MMACIQPVHHYVSSAHASRLVVVERREREHLLAAGAPVPLLVSGAERTLCWVLPAVSVLTAGLGTAWGFLPVEEAGMR